MYSAQCHRILDNNLRILLLHLLSDTDAESTEIQAIMQYYPLWQEIHVSWSSYTLHISTWYPQGLESPGIFFCFILWPQKP